MKKLIKQWSIGIAVVVALILGVRLFGEVYRANIVLFGLLWLSIPVFAILLKLPSVSTCLTLTGLRRVQVILMTAVMGISFLMFFDFDTLRNEIGKRFIEGYRHWRAEAEIDDYGSPGDEWTAKNTSDRLGLRLLEIASLVAVFGLPVITLRGTNAAICKKKAECLLTGDGRRVETYESSD